ncbi:MAG: hypothetical protein ACRCSG_07135 [Cellulosilyticaceae bacterium]
MKESNTIETHKNNEICCNKCGDKVEIFPNNRHADYLKIKKQWGYFSNKDLTTHSFVICEHCYDKLIESFVIPVNEKPVIEIFDPC